MLELILNFEAELFIYVVVVILITRIWLHSTYRLFSAKKFINSSPTIGRIKMHHYMYGILIIIFGLILDNLYITAIGLGFFLDELPLILKYGNKFYWQEYKSKFSLISIFVIIVVCMLIFFYSKF